jgi:hypothetical protein
VTTRTMLPGVHAADGREERGAGGLREEMSEHTNMGSRFCCYRDRHGVPAGASASLHGIWTQDVERVEVQSEGAHI